MCDGQDRVESPIVFSGVFCPQGTISIVTNVNCGPAGGLGCGTHTTSNSDNGTNNIVGGQSGPAHLTTPREVFPDGPDNHTAGNDPCTNTTLGAFYIGFAKDTPFVGGTGIIGLQG
jgi:hypothetical protein